jgi:hypothetical protein
MSYSFSAKGATKAEAIADAEMKFAKVVSEQPVHLADQEAALIAMRMMVDLCADPLPDEEILITMHGSVGGEWDGGLIKRLTSVSGGSSAATSRKIVPAA